MKNSSQNKNNPVQSPRNFPAGSRTQLTLESRPIPHPDDFRGYEEVLPGSADRILKMAEKEQESRIDQEKTIINDVSRSNYRSQIFGFILGLLGISGTIFLLYSGKSLEGASVFIASIGWLILNAVYKIFRDRRQDKSEADEKL